MSNVKQSTTNIYQNIQEVLHGKPQGDVYFVNSALGDDSFDGTFEHPKATVDGGVNACTGSHGDVVVIINAGAVYDENAAITGVTMDTAGVTLLGVDEPVLANSNGAATDVIEITAAYCSVIGINITEVTITVRGIYINGVDYCVVRNCIIWGDVLYGVYLNNADWNQVYRNHIAEQGTLNHAGIRIDGSSRSNRITSNWMDNTDKGIWLEAGTQTQNLLLGNVIGGSGAGTSIGIYINGAGANHTEVKDNWITDCVATITDTGTSSDFANNHEDYTAFNNTVLYTDEDRWDVMKTLWAADGANIFNPTIGGTARTDLELAFEAIAALIDISNRPTAALLEIWPNAVVDVALWTVTDPATGTAWNIGTQTWLGRGIDTVLNAAETARLVSDQVWDVLPGEWGTDTVQRNLIVEFEAKFADVANLDNTICFFGLTSTAADTRASNDIIGFCLTADVLATLSDNGGAETTNTTFAETLTDLNKFKMVITAGSCVFSLNEVTLATHTTNLPDNPMFLNFYLDTEAGVATFELGKVRIWWEDA